MGYPRSDGERQGGPLVVALLAGGEQELPIVGSVATAVVAVELGRDVEVRHGDLAELAPAVVENVTRHRSHRAAIAADEVGERKRERRGKHVHLVEMVEPLVVIGLEQR